jgi:HD-like signal output (HDOD) protein/CheY-like chemotaxis protein
MKNQILFVDDDINILNGLRRMLRGMRKEWDITFLDSGAQALLLIQDQPFDVVVSDMRMPGIDGATLLKEVRKVQPRAVRIILSGFAEEEIVLKTVGPAHQYLAKPCESESLVKTINRALKLRQFLGNVDLQKLISGVDRLPSPPTVYTRIVTLLESAQSGVSDIADVIAKDVAMTAQIMKLINSAFFALPQKVENLKQAVALLGVDTIKALVLVVGIFEQFSGNGATADKIKLLSERSLGIGEVARAIATDLNLKQDEIDQAGSAGVLTHVGTLILLANWPERFEQAVKLVEEEGLSIMEAEESVFGARHPEIGAYLLGLWGFTDPITEAVAYHHCPRLLPADENPSVAICVYAAQHLLRTVMIPSTDPTDVLTGAEIDMDYLRELGLDGKVPDWAGLVQRLKEKGDER